MEQAKNYSDLTQEDKVKREADIYNKTEGNLQGYNCQKCKNKGIIYIACNCENAFGQPNWELKTRICECKKIREAINRIEESGLSKLIQDYTFDNYKTYEDWQHEIISVAHQYVNNLNDWFFIGGQPGSGKTHICTAIAGKILKAKSKPVKYMLWQDDVTTLKQTVANDTNTYNSLMEQFQRTEVLYIDDFFKTKKGEYISAADVNMAFKIINYRYNEHLPTIISSELSIQQIASIDEATGSRIAERSKNYKLYIQPDINKNQRFKMR